MHPVDLKITPIDGEDATAMLTLGYPDQGGGGEVHWLITILPHKFAHARVVFVSEIEYLEPANFDHVP